MIQRLLNWYYFRKLKKTERNIRFYQRQSADLAHVIYNLKEGSPELVLLYESTQSSLKKERDKLSKLQRICGRDIPVRQSS